MIIKSVVIFFIIFVFSIVQGIIICIVTFIKVKFVKGMNENGVEKGKVLILIDF